MNKTLAQNLTITFLILFSIVQVKGQNDSLAYTNTCLSIEERVNDLVSRMTLEEKVAQMLDVAPAIPRLGIPEYNWWNECLHGVARAGAATSFPQAIGLAATWNPELIQEMADAISTEARAKYNQSTMQGFRDRYQGLTMWSPNINIFRDPRWGRGQETYGEDPYLTARMGVAFIKGLQGDDADYLKVIATPKHFAVHSGPEPERHSFDAYTNPKDLWETYLPAFEASIKEANAGSVMSAYNRYLGESATASPFLLTDILRKKWGFKGYVVSDCGAVQDIYEYHKIVATPEEAAAMAVKAGCDLNCGNVYAYLAESVKKGLILEEEINKAVKRLFTARFKLGLFESPENSPFSHIDASQNESEQHQKLALEVARESMVLLKNEEQTLPLSPSIKKIAVIGPHANDHQFMMGNYFGTPSHRTSILEGIQNSVSKQTEVYYHKACELALKESLMDGVPTTVFGKEGIKVEYFTNIKFEGEPIASRKHRRIDFDWGGAAPVENMEKKNWSVRYTATLCPKENGLYYFKSKVLGGSSKVFLNDKLVYQTQASGSDQQMEAIQLVKNKTYALKLEYSCVNEWLSACQLQWNTPLMRDRHLMFENIKSSDAIVYVGGISPRLEGEEMPVAVDGFRGGDRTHLKLPKVQLELLKQLNALGKPIIFVSTSGSAMAYNWEHNNLDAILQAWYPGQAGGQAVADVIFGKYNPGGKLPITFYKSVNDLPPFDDYHMEGRTYRYFRKEALYPFGHGLSYSELKYSTPICLNHNFNDEKLLDISIKVTNKGTLPANEVVQLYINDKQASVAVPMKSLKRFQRISLAIGETKKIQFHLQKKDFALIDMEGNTKFESGEFEIIIGGSSMCDNKTTIIVR